MNRKNIIDGEGNYRGWVNLDTALRLDATNFSRDGYIYQRDLIITPSRTFLWNPWSNVQGHNNDRYIQAESPEEIVEWVVHHGYEDEVVRHNPELADLIKSKEL